jgi:glycosyltransferase involved in cell wall biosynthesis
MSRRVDWLVSEMNIVGGAETYVRATAPRLRAAGWDLRVLSLVSGGDLITGLRSEGVQVVELGVRHKADLGGLLRLLRQWRADRPDLVHTHLYHAGVLGRLAARLLRISPLVVHQHGLELARSGVRSLLDRSLSPLAQRYIASCEAVARQLSLREGIPARKISVIYDGIGLDPGSGQPAAKEAGGPEERQEFTKAFGLQPGCLHLVCVGRMAPEKGQAFLLEALALLDGQLPDLQTVLFGDGPLKEELEERCARLGLTGRVRFAGQRQDIRRWLPFFDLFVLPSAWEGLSQALLEAMAAGLPVAATAVGGNPEAVLEGETGLLIPPGDPTALASAIARLAQDPALRQRMGVAGRRRVEAHFDQAKTVQELGSLYEDLLNVR